MASNFYVSSVAYTAVTAWASGVAKSVGNYVRQTAPAVGSERVFKATSISGTGTTGGVEPTWVITAGATTTDNAGANQIVWTEVTGKESEQSAANWTAPFARLATALTLRVTNAAGDYVFVSSDHNETQASAMGVTAGASFPETRIICVSRAGGSSVPPVTADLAMGGALSTTSTNSITFRGCAYYRGITVNAGSVANAANIQFGNAVDHLTFDTCSLVLNNTSGSSRFTPDSASGDQGATRLINTTLTFGATGQSITPTFNGLTWLYTASAILGTAPTALFNSGSANGSIGPINIKGVDLSAVTGTLITNPSGRTMYTLTNCQLASGVTLVSGSPPNAYDDETPIVIDNCDDSVSGKNYRSYRVYRMGTVQQDSTVVRTGGATDGVTPISWKMATTGATTPTLAYPLPMPGLAKRYNSGGSPTATVEFLANATTALTSAQIWLEIEALTTSGIPISGLSTNRVANLLPGTSASAHSATTSAWDSLAPARQNNHAYVVGDVFQVTGTNAGRVFFVTTAGTSAVSEPAAYGTAVDGTTITTDRNGGGLVVQTMMRQKLAVPFTPLVKGIVRAVVKLAGASQTVYVDRKLTIA